MNVREIAYRSLIRIEKDKRYSSLEIESCISSSDLQGEDKAFYTRLVYGVLERRITLDYVISSYSSKGISRLDLSTLVLLRLGAYQILFLDKVPASAAVNECVKLASRYSSRSKGFINAILRKISLLNGIPLPDKESDLCRYYSVKYSLPEEICRIWMKDYPEHGERIFELVNSTPFITLRLNDLKVNANTDAVPGGISYERCQNAPHGLRLKEHVSIDKLDFESGLYYVQDEASQIAVEALDAREGHTLIDVCSCPGGKSFGCAINMNNKGRIYSFDIHQSKLSLIESGAKRLGIGIISTFSHDSTLAKNELLEQADRVICDVPCSGLGVVAKKSDLRYKDLSTLNELCEIQYKILKESSRYLKCGGYMIYSTCTLRKAENEDTVNRFLKENPDFSLVPFKVGQIESDGMLTLIPYIHGTDGFFVAKLTKN